MKLQQDVTLSMQSGLQTSEAALLAQVANRYSSKIMLQHGSRLVNVKSMMGCLSLGLSKGDTVTLLLDGADAEPAFQAVSAVLSAQHAQGFL